MTNAKWLALLAAFGLALTMAACDDEEDGACPDDAQCLEASDTCPARCDLGTPTACTDDEDCADDETCSPGCGCIVACTPDDGTGGTGPQACDGQAECYPDSYCGDTSECVSLATTISECNVGPDAPAANGPMLLTIVQLAEGGATNCVKDPATCTNNGNICWFAVSAYDPDGDFPATGLYDNTKFVRSDTGAEIATYNARNGVIDSTNNKFFDFEVAGCFPEDVTDLGGAFLLLDNANNKSNAACLSFANGTAP